MNKIFLEYKNVKYENFTSFSFEKSIDNFCSSFECEATITDDITLLPFRLGEKVSVYIDSNKIFTGYLEDINIRHSPSEHSINISGRSKNCDLLDSTFINPLTIKANTTLQAIIERVIHLLGSDMKVVDKVGNLKKFNSTEIVSSEFSDNCFEFIEKHSRQRQVFLNDTVDGDIAIYRPQNNVIGVKLIKELNGTNNNILDSSFQYSEKKKYGKIAVKGQGNPVSVNFTGKELSEQTSTILDTQTRSTRQIGVKPEKETSASILKDRAVWENNIRQSRAITYGISVQGFYYDDTHIYEIGNLVYVKDSFSGIDSNMLIKSVRFNQTLDGGSITQLELVPKGSYTQEPYKTNKVYEGDSTPSKNVWWNALIDKGDKK